jgi:TolA-binding protein
VGFGVYALDPKSKEAKSWSDLVCKARTDVDMALQHVAEGQPKDWWAWWRYVDERNWSSQSLAQQLLEANGEVDRMTFIEPLKSQMVKLAQTLEKRFSKTPSP